MVITLIVNGQPRAFNSNSTLTQLLDELNLTGKRLAVERNGEIVPRSQHATTQLHEGDQLEVVVAVGGG